MGLMSSGLFGPIVIMVVITTVVTPILLQFVFKDKNDTSGEIKSKEATEAVSYTHLEDIAMAEYIIGKTGTSELCVGHGYDVHRLVEGRKLILCGVEVPNKDNLGLLGHSDADVAVHALMDARCV